MSVVAGETIWERRQRFGIALAEALKAGMENMSAELGARLGATFENVEIDECFRVRARLSDGSIVIIDPEHLVPRDYFDANPVENLTPAKVD